MQPSYRYSTYESVKRSGNQGGEINLPQITSGLTDIEGAKAIARRLFDTYDRDRDGNINGVETVPMIVDVYKAFNRSFTPSKGDIDAYGKVMDRNRDGRVSLQDLEDLCIRYLVGGRMEVVKTEVVKRSAPAPPQYTKEALQRLEVARRLFRMFDKDGSNQLNGNEVGALLIETYRQMGMTNFQPTSEDINSFMELVDRDHDGIVNLEDYEAYILKSLKDAGIKIEVDQMKF